MKIVFSDHALVKMGQRKISRGFVIKVAKNPDFIKPSYGFREERYKKLTRNYLKVVVIKEDKGMVVVTAHWVAKIKIK